MFMSTVRVAVCRLCSIGTVSYGPRSEELTVPEVAAAKLGNVVLVPDRDTYHRLPWAANGRYRVSEILCDPHWLPSCPAGGGAQEGSPRVAARRQLEELARLGFTLRSAFECEFTVVDAPTRRPVFDGVDIFTSLRLAPSEALLYELGTQLAQSGVHVETYQVEYSPGQFELTLKPEVGLRAADSAFTFKEAVKEFYLGKGYQATFMAKPFANGGTSGLHFNHSLIDKLSGKKVFSDQSQQNGMSDIARYWLGGLLKHTRAITALLAPTVNCYRRYAGEWAPTNANWAVDDRQVSYRVKNEKSSDVYMENRIPSAAANPYLVLAATVAAGIDGIRNKIDCDDVLPVPLPATLAEAVTCLNEDVVLRESLGDQLVSWFTLVKRGVELEKLKDDDILKDDPEMFELERELYFTFL